MTFVDTNVLLYAYAPLTGLDAARALGCDTVLSEDLQDGMDFDGVRVENPFRRL